jgi:hypothetical protein
VVCLTVSATGRLDGVPVVAMGGWVEAPAAGLPAWGPEMDCNIQCDTSAASGGSPRPHLTLVTLPATLQAHLAAAELPRLAASGSLGDLLARQAKATARTTTWRNRAGNTPPYPRTW